MSQERARTVVDDIVRSLSAEILSGDRTPGDRLPSYRALNERFDVTMPTTQRAMAKLEEMGLVEIRQGSGAVVLEPLISARPGVLPYWLNALRGAPWKARHVLEDFLELRRDIAVRMVIRFRENEEPETDDRVRERVQEMADAINSGAPLEDIVEADIAVAQELLRGADQIAYATIFNSFARLLRALPELQRAMYSSPRQNVRGWEAAIALIEAPDEEADARIIENIRAALEQMDKTTVDTFQTILEEAS